MKVALLQQDIAWGEPEANRRAVEQAVSLAPKSDLYVLPEMFSTGFATRPESVAERDGGSLRWMCAMADRLGAAFAGSVATEERGRYFNRLYFVKPGGDVRHYDKRHLFTYGGEHLRYTAGSERVVVEWCGVRFLLQVCYDLRFPVWSRNRGDYDAALYVASWPKSRRAVWDILLRARAIENQCYVLGVNRIGADPSCEYDGGTMAIDAYGHVVAQCPDGESSSAVLDLDLPSLRSFRHKFPVLEDRDTFEIL